MNEELISMVRSIAKHGADWRINEVLNRAADALEAAEKRIVELNAKCANLQSQINEMENEIEELMPKRGEWAYGKTNYCTNCGADMRKGEHDEQADS